MSIPVPTTSPRRVAAAAAAVATLVLGGVAAVAAPVGADPSAGPAATAGRGERDTRDRPVLRRLWRGALRTAADALGTSAADLRAELVAGRSVAQVAEDRGVPVDDVVAALADAATSRLERAVDRGVVAQERADALLEELPERIERRLSTPRRDARD